MCEHNIIIGKWEYYDEFGGGTYLEKFYNCVRSNFALFDPYAKPCNKVIRRISWEQFEQSGWITTKDRPWSYDGKEVFVCPECQKEREHERVRRGSKDR